MVLVTQDCEAVVHLLYWINRCWVIMLLVSTLVVLVTSAWFPSVLVTSTLTQLRGIWWRSIKQLGQYLFSTINGVALLCLLNVDVDDDDSCLIFSPISGQHRSSVVKFIFSYPLELKPTEVDDETFFRCLQRTELSRGTWTTVARGSAVSGCCAPCRQRDTVLPLICQWLASKQTNGWIYP